MIDPRLKFAFHELVLARSMTVADAAQKYAQRQRRYRERKKAKGG
jgi:hypothetical protein